MVDHERTVHLGKKKRVRIRKKAGNPGQNQNEVIEDQPVANLVAETGTNAPSVEEEIAPLLNM